MAATVSVGIHPTTRSSAIDNLRVVLVIGVIVGHATMAWTGVGDWVFTEPPVREPMLTALVLVEVVAALFAIPVFFFLAGLFTPSSFQRKGLRRFMRDRFLRLGLPMAFFVLLISPLVEYVDPDWSGWEQGFWAFLPEVWWPPAPGPTWFLGVLLAFSTAYAVLRTLRPKAATPSQPRLRGLAAAVALMAIVSYLVRIRVPLGQEMFRLALGQSPSWILGFSLGIAAAEQGWLEPLSPHVARLAGRTALASALTLVGSIVSLVLWIDAEMEPFAGGGTPLSLLVAATEGTLIVAMAFWLVDLFRRRLARQGPTLRIMGRSAFAAFVIHQLILVWLVLASRLVDLPAEVEYVAVAGLGVAISFGVGALMLRIPVVSRIL